MNVVENYYNKKQDVDAIHHIEDNPDTYEEFARLHPELYVTVKPKRYTLLDGGPIDIIEEKLREKGYAR